MWLRLVSLMKKAVMDKITATLSKLNQADLDLLGIYLKNQPKKIEFLNHLLNCKSDELNYEEISLIMGYAPHSKAFYTLKHRFLNDIQHFKLLAGKNEIGALEGRIKNLRMILYSRESKILEEEINELKKECARLEIYRGLYEINLCDFLLHYPNASKRNQILKRMNAEYETERIFNTAELEFYRIIFEYQDIYYSGFIHTAGPDEKEMETLNSCQNKLNSNITTFFKISAELTFALKPFPDKNKLEAYHFSIGNYSVSLKIPPLLTIWTSI